MSTMMLVVPMSGSRATRTTNGTTMIQNGTVPWKKLLIWVPRVASQCAR